jgi:hypothetical protein
MEARGLRGCFDMGEDERAEAAAGEIGMDEDGADFGGVDGWVEEVGLADGGSIAAEEGFAFRPASAGGEDCFTSAVFGFNDEVSLVADQLGVEAEDCAQRGFDLRRGVVVGLQAADGSFDQGVQGWDVGILCCSDMPDCIGCGHGEFRLNAIVDGCVIVILVKQRMGRDQSAERALPTHSTRKSKVTNLLSA